jgi:hypothetical protein
MIRCGVKKFENAKPLFSFICQTAKQARKKKRKKEADESGNKRKINKDAERARNVKNL